MNLYFNVIWLVFVIKRYHKRPFKRSQLVVDYAIRKLNRYPSKFKLTRYTGKIWTIDVGNSFYQLICLCRWQFLKFLKIK